MAAKNTQVKPGIVYLIGAGPGDPGLLTLAGRDALRRADVVAYDYLVSPAILRHCRPEAELIYVGKKAGSHAASQEQITQLLIDHARAGTTVARLKGGDPFVFGRGGEEAEELAAAGIAWEVIPGVTSAFAVPAYAGIPVTHRASTPLVTVVTGHEDPQKPSAGPSIPWEALGPGPSTLVFLMGVGNLSHNMEQLMAYGRDPDTPAAAIQWGTRPEQRTVTGTVRTLDSVVAAEHIRAPAIVIVGDVIRHREHLQWFEKRPLFGRRIMVTRTREQASAFSDRLRELGADVIEIPTIAVRPPARWTTLAKALRNQEKFHWMIFTSANGVRFARKAMHATGGDVRSLKGVKLCAIGPATARALEEWGLPVDCIPGEFQAEGIVAALAEQTRVKGKRILIPRAKQARDYLPRALRRAGAEVKVVTAYETVCPPSSVHLMSDWTQGVWGHIDMVTFTSSSTVTHFVELAQQVPGRKKSAPIVPEDTVVGCIGPITADAAREHGLAPAVMPDEWTIPAFVTAIRNYFAKPPAGK